MPEFKDLPAGFCCPYAHGCPYLEGLSTSWVWQERQEAAFLQSDYERQLEQLNELLDEERRRRQKAELETQQLRAQLSALHRRQFKGRQAPVSAASDCPSGRRKKKPGAPKGHPPWQRPKPKHIDQTIQVPAPKNCPHCHATDLEPVQETLEHVQEDIVLEPRLRAVCYVHGQGHCPHCDKNVVQPGPGELVGSYIGPAAKATALYMRQELNVSFRKISRFFAEFFGLKFVPASAYGFERQAVRRGQPLYEDLRQKIRALPAAHGDETGWRADGQNRFVWYGGNEDLAFFEFGADRSGQTAQRLFGENFAGVLISDAYASYNAIHPKDWQSCLFHLKNKAQELHQELALLEGTAADPVARRFCQEVQGWVHTTCQAHRRLVKRGWRVEAAKRAQQPCRRRLRQICRQPLVHARTEAFRQRLLGQEQDHFFTCFRYPEVPPTNSQAERSMRPVVLMRHVVHCTRSPKGLENHSVLRSLFETARRQGRKVHQVFFDLFTKDTAAAQAALYRNQPQGKAAPASKPKKKKPP